MQILPLSTVKARLSELVDSAALTRNEVVITKNGRPAAVIVGTDAWESLQETLFWLSQPDIREDVAQAKAEIAAGEGLSEEEIRAQFGVPNRKGNS
ncbi:antitoxin [Arthrobacter sp. PAMC 25486]|uniref:type II toxin-antitoxin system Phd/YefM family antitoxin n=1 Tax=Arthrobacter sp. PAMC 25486 TaxID=1494608 RepID=UPI0005361DF5|nr:type II toxin-antitoxin system Phd/YefM family antitoxin [Arthrobacter sp. PAMC 25486]AIY03446.1 antitoxin [Arthrobacter sp. PAMC 25486]